MSEFIKSRETEATPFDSVTTPLSMLQALNTAAQADVDRGVLSPDAYQQIMLREAQALEAKTAELEAVAVITQAEVDREQKAFDTLKASELDPQAELLVLNQLQSELQSTEANRVSAVHDSDQGLIDAARDMIALRSDADGADAAVLEAARGKLDELQAHQDLPPQAPQTLGGLDQVHNPADMIDALNHQLQPEKPIDPNGDLLLDTDHADRIEGRVAEVKGHDEARHDEAVALRDDLAAQLKADGQHFKDLPMDERSEFFQHQLQAWADSEIEHGQLKIDCEDDFVDSGRTFVSAVADSGLIEARVLDADSAKLDELSGQLDRDRGVHAQQAEAIRGVVDDTLARYQNGETIEAARQHALEARYDDLPADLQAQVHAGSPAAHEDGAAHPAASDHAAPAEHADASVSANG